MINQQNLHNSIPTKTLALSDLYHYPYFSYPRLSHDGAYIAYLAPAPEGGAPTIWRAPAHHMAYLAKGGTIPDSYALIKKRTRPLSNFTWLYTNDHIVFIEDVDGNEKGHLYLHTISTGKTINITPFPGARVLPSYFIAPHKPTTIILQTNQRDEGLYDLMSYSLETNTLTMLEENPGNVLSWYVDHNLESRARATFTPDNVVTLYTRKTVHDTWTPRIIWQSEDTFTSHGLFFSPDNKAFYFSSNAGTNTNNLQYIHLESGTITSVFQDPEYDVYHEASLTDMLDKTPPMGSTIWNNEHTLSAFSYFRERVQWKFIDQEIELNHPLVHELLTDKHYESWIEHQNSKFMVIGQCNTTTPPHYFIYNKQEKSRIFLGSSRPGLSEKLHSKPTKPISVITGDGLVVHGYLTLPEGDHGPHPLVLKIHGGPWTRDVFTYSPDIQMLVNNGYACLQVNYRSSTGYGKRFACAGIKQLGASMIDDVILLTQYACTHYPLDTNRIAYMGRSYGGFSALSAGWRYQHLFKAIIAQVPPTDLGLLQNSYPKHWSMFKYHFQRRIGHPEYDKHLLDSQSPVNHGHKTKIPTLISYGIHDARVIPEHIHNYIKIMDSSPKNKVLCFENEGHFNALQENLIHHWQSVLDFLNTHNK